MNFPRGLSYMELSVKAKESDPNAGPSFPVLAELDGIEISDIDLEPVGEVGRETREKTRKGMRGEGWDAPCHIARSDLGRGRDALLRDPAHRAAEEREARTEGTEPRRISRL